jgi:hypothetical protein
MSKDASISPSRLLLYHWTISHSISGTKYNKHTVYLYSYKKLIITGDYECKCNRLTVKQNLMSVAFMKS